MRIFWLNNASVFSVFSGQKRLEGESHLSQVDVVDVIKVTRAPRVHPDGFSLLQGIMHFSLCRTLNAQTWKTKIKQVILV